jgi:hypothetical protein
LLLSFVSKARDLVGSTCWLVGFGLGLCGVWYGPVGRSVGRLVGGVVGWFGLGLGSIWVCGVVWSGRSVGRLVGWFGLGVWCVV